VLRIGTEEVIGNTYPGDFHISPVMEEVSCEKPECSKSYLKRASKP
jgi:hypothetical protein